MLQNRKHTLASIAIVASIVLSLTVLAQPTGAVATTVTGPDQVERHEMAEFTVVVDPGGDDLTVDGYRLRISVTDSDDAATVLFGPDGDVRSITPRRGVVGHGEIRINTLRRGLTITPVDTDDDTGYGYGYGYGDNSRVAFDVSIPTKALKHGTYAVTVGVDTADGTNLYPSSPAEFDVAVPSDDDRDDRDDQNDRDDRDHRNDRDDRDDRTDRDDRDDRTDRDDRHDRDGRSDRRFDLGNWLERLVHAIYERLAGLSDYFDGNGGDRGWRQVERPDFRPGGSA